MNTSLDNLSNYYGFGTGLGTTNSPLDQAVSQAPSGGGSLGSLLGDITSLANIGAAGYQTVQGAINGTLSTGKAPSPAATKTSTNMLLYVVIAVVAVVALVFAVRKH